MSVSTFIRDQVLLNRLKRSSVLVVYDPARHYRDLCHELASDTIAVIDASKSSIESREVAIGALAELGKGDGTVKELVVYVPAAAPVTDEDRQHDPFSIYGACGSVFPDGDGDEYESLCLKAKPDHATAIRGIFNNDPNPPFAVIDKVGGGIGWPTLRALLGAESARDILFALLVPSERQQEKLKAQDSWVNETREVLKATLGLTLKTRAKAWEPIADELWRFLLFSEFVFDLPEALPTALGGVPHAPEAAQSVVEDLCDRLRHDQRTRAVYIDQAEAIEAELNLPALCVGISDLGRRDTFPFEERTFLARATHALLDDDTDLVRDIVGRHADSVWTGKGEIQAQWSLVQAAMDLIEACEDFERQLPDHARSQEALIEFYLGGLREADRRQREFERAAGDYFDIEGDLSKVIDQARSRYRRLAEKVQVPFTKHLETAGWPPVGRLANAEVFDRLVAPSLKESGRRIAYVLVDALRYELGLALHQELAEDDPFQLEAAFAQLPTITPVGMASLLPGAGQSLTLAKKDDGFVPMLGGTMAGNVSQRMAILRKQYGDRFAEMRLSDFLRPKKSPPETAHLLVLRSVDIDEHLENNPDSTLGLIHDILKRIRVAINKLKKLGFDEVVIATDHGFFLNAQAEAGDVCSKPAGDWIVVHDRSLLGEGNADNHSFAIGADKAGIRGDFGVFAGPRSMAPYRAGVLYFHGGASLQEAVVPVLSAKLTAAKQPAAQQATVAMSYKNGATRITTRLPVVDVILESADLLSQEADFEILLEAHDKKGNVVGEAKPGGPVNPATGTVILKPGEQLQVILKMQLEFEGKFTVKALNPTTLAAYCSLDLKTDYAM